ncbi:MAG TPA: hypothetical protein VND98_12080 [Solirubrobacterales bacterium]|nr:hypothetical protein [Solirubrobacterales bacterium]
MLPDGERKAKAERAGRAPLCAAAATDAVARAANMQVAAIA